VGVEIERLSAWQMLVLQLVTSCELGLGCEMSDPVRHFLIDFKSHSGGVLMYKRTTVQRALGHRQITTTEVYAKVSDHLLRRAVGLAG